MRPGAHIINVHALGGVEMMRAAVEAAQERADELGITAPHIFAVTILTSHGAEDLAELGLHGGPGENATRLAALARDAGCSGVVCSAHEVARSQEFLRSGLSHAYAGHSSGGRGARRSKARDDAGASGRRRRRLSRRRTPDHSSCRSAAAAARAVSEDMHALA